MLMQRTRYERFDFFISFVAFLLYRKLCKAYRPSVRFLIFIAFVFSELYYVNKNFDANLDLVDTLCTDLKANKINTKK